MYKKKRTGLMLALGLMVTSTIGTSFTMSSQPWAQSGRSGLKVYTKATFTNQKVKKGNKYHATAGKVVSKSIVRLKEGSYNKSKTCATPGVENKISKFNNPFKKAAGSWTWKYKK